KGAFIQIRISRKTLIASIVSVLVHLLALYLFTLLPKQQSPIDASNQSFNVTLTSPEPPQAKAPPEPVKQTAPKLSPKPRQQSRVIAQQSPPVPAANQFTVPRQPVVPPKPVTPPTLPPPIAPPNPNQPKDLASYAKEQKAKRGETDDSATAVDQSSNASSAPPPNGMHGVFRLTYMDNRRATYTFRGWKGDMSFTHLETYAVEAPIGGDIRRELIRSQIAIIQRDFSGDFLFYSDRMQRAVTLSARKEDTPELEDFLMREAFGQ
ncbi:MAG TPA: hypothetical protein VIE69_01165, partial [Methylophilaceae bacterium]